MNFHVEAIIALIALEMLNKLKCASSPREHFMPYILFHHEKSFNFPQMLSSCNQD